jgi:hypothetical protein
VVVSRLNPTRRALLTGLAAACWPSRGAADEALPFPKQIELLAKVAQYDRNFAARAQDRVRASVLLKPGSDASARAAGQLVAALAQASFGGVPCEPTQDRFEGAAAVASSCKARKLCLVYLTPGMGDDAAAIARALEGVDVLSVASDAAYVPLGTVLGFDVISGKPKLLVHLTQAKRQNVDFKAEVLKLMKVYT